MARIESDPNYSAPTFSRATAATDLFKKEDVQNLAAAVSTHDHSTGKGVAVPFATAIPNGTITSAMIADATIDTADLKDGAVTSAKILDGTIATGDLANAAVTNAKLGADTARANLLTNGGFEIWQRGNGPFTANGAYTADRWQISTNGTDALSVSKQPQSSALCPGSNWCAGFAFTKGSGTITNLQQNLIVADTGLKGSTLSFSMMVLSTVPSTVRLRIAANGTGAPTSDSAQHSGSGGWEKLTCGPITVPLDATLIIVYVFFQNTTASGYLDNAMLVVGNVAADYVPLHPADDLARCLRYYERVDDQSAGGGSLVVAGIATAGGQQAFATFVFRAIKAVSPTVTRNGTWTTSNCGQATAGLGGVFGVRLDLTASAAGQFLTTNNAANCSLVAEANP